MTAGELISRGLGHLRRRGDDVRRVLRIYNCDERAVLAFRDTHPGAACFIVGNGPSLRIADVERARAAGFVCFASNKIYKIYPQTDWRPDYYCCTDPLVFEQNVDDILAAQVCPIFLRRDSKPLVQAYESLHGKCAEDIGYITYCWRHSGRTAFYPQAANVLSASTVTFTMIELAWMMGFRRIYLIGCDHSYVSFAGRAPGTQVSDAESLNGDYFFKDYVRPGEVVGVWNRRLMEEGYRLAREYIESHGGEIYNATRGGKLEIFERVDLDNLLSR